MIKKIGIILFIAFITKGVALPAMVDLKNILSIDGMTDNPILGYGLVVGLKGTGDSENGSQTREIISRIANNFGFKVSPERLKPRNCAVVLCSSLITPFSQPGSHVDVRVSSIYDAKSLEGGELVITPLIAGDNAIYAVAQGSLMTEKNGKGVIGHIPQGAIIQKPVDTSILSTNNEISVTIQESLGYSAVAKAVDALRKRFPDSVKQIKNNKITLTLPQNTEVQQFVSDVYSIKVDVPDEPSVLIDSKSGMLISGGQVVITEAAIAYAGTKVSIGGGTSSWGANSGQTSGGAEGNMKLVKSSATVQELVDSLNQIGASGNDIAKILQLLYRNGNLKAKLIVQ